MPVGKPLPADSLEAGVYDAEQPRNKRTLLFAGIALLALVLVGAAVGIAVARLSDDVRPHGPLKPLLVDPAGARVGRYAAAVTCTLASCLLS